MSSPIKSRFSALASSDGKKPVKRGVKAHQDAAALEREKTLSNRQKKGRPAPAPSEDSDAETLSQEVEDLLDVTQRPEEDESAPSRPWAALHHCPPSADFDERTEKKSQRRFHLEAAEYQRFLENRVEGPPRSRMVYADSGEELKKAREELAANPSFDLALHIGQDERPVYLLFLKTRSGGYTPHVVLLHTGKFSDEEMRSRFAWIEDKFQSNRGPRPTADSPFVSSFKTALSYADLEALRLKGPLLLRRASEMLKEAHPRPEVYPLDLVLENLEPVPDDQQALRVKLAKNEDDGISIQLSRVGTAMSGTQVQVPGTMVSLRAVELAALLDVMDEVWVEGCRLAWNRLSVAQTRATETREAYLAGLDAFLLKQARLDCLDEESERRDIFNLVARLVRGKPSGQLKRLVGQQTRGTKDFFAAFHMEQCQSRRVRCLCQNLLKSLQAAKAGDD